MPISQLLLVCAIGSPFSAQNYEGIRNIIITLIAGDRWLRWQLRTEVVDSSRDFTKFEKFLQCKIIKYKVTFSILFDKMLKFHYQDLS